MTSGENPVVPLKASPTGEIPVCEWAMHNGTCTLDELQKGMQELREGFTRLADIVKRLHVTVEEMQKRLEEKLP